jgi:uncharacterized protein (DUF1330 family)
MGRSTARPPGVIAIARRQAQPTNQRGDRIDPPWCDNLDLIMPAYWVARATISDPVQYKKYTDLVPDIVARFGGTILARGGRYQIMEGPETFHRFIVIEFPTLEQGVACFQSPEYQKAAAYRRGGAGVVENVIVEGV